LLLSLRVIHPTHLICPLHTAHDCLRNIILSDCPHRHAASCIRMPWQQGPTQHGHLYLKSNCLHGAKSFSRR
jgi:hypothetical protein